MDILPLAFLLASMVILNISFRPLELKILGAFGVIVVISMLSLGMEGGPVGSVAEYIGVTVRFVPLFVLIRFTSEDFREKVIPHIKLIYWILSGLAILNLVAKDAYISAMLPPGELFGEVMPTTYTDPGISASFVNTVEFAFFFLALTVLYLDFAKSSRTRLWVYVISAFLITMSFSIASILGILLVIFLRSKRKWLVGSIIGSGLLLSFLVMNSYIEELLGMDIAYWIEISSEFNRLGYFTKVLPEFLSGHFKDLVLGMGYDAEVVDGKLASYFNTPYVMINNENNLKYLKDVYWLSVLFAQGIMVLGITLGVLRYLWKSVLGTRYSVFGKGEGESINTYRILILLVLFFGFFNQILDIKAFTYIFWLTLALGTRHIDSLTEYRIPSTEYRQSPTVVPS